MSHVVPVFVNNGRNVASHLNAWVSHLAGPGTLFASKGESELANVLCNECCRNDLSELEEIHGSSR